jgi:haloacetate dehalogenase
MFEGFANERVRVGDVEIHARVGGSGPPVLLLHGYPQTHVIWHAVAPLLARDHTVVVPDLRGYGDSSKPPGTPSHVEYAKRTMAADQVGLMGRLGFERFGLAGHDRGGRVSHRLARDHPYAVARLAVLDIVPTHHAFSHADMAFGRAYSHWFFLAQGGGLPEHFIGLDPDDWIRRLVRTAPGVGRAIEPEALEEYLRCFRDPACIHATCEDYRAAATIDFAHDEEDRAAGRRVQAPVLALWAEHGFLEKAYDVVDVWRSYAGEVTGRSLPANHYLPEQLPEQVAELLGAFFAAA